MVSLFQNVPSKSAGICCAGASMVEIRLAAVGAFIPVAIAVIAAQHSCLLQASEPSPHKSVKSKYPIDNVENQKYPGRGSTTGEDIMSVGLSLPRIRNFVAVAEERQFRRAAERVGLSQPALSAQLRELEEFLGAALLSRTTRSVHLTAEGEKFLVRARNILADLESAVLEVRDHASLAARAPVGGGDPVGRLADAAGSRGRRFHAALSRHRRADHRARRARCGALRRQRQRRSRHCARRRTATANWPFRSCCATALSGWCRRTARWRGGGGSGWKPCSNIRSITTVPGTSIRSTLERACREHGQSLRVTHSVTQHQTIVAMVGAGTRRRAAAGAQPR